MKRIITCILALAMSFSLLCVPAFAVQENSADRESELLYMDVVARGPYRPSEYHNLSNADYTGYLIDLAASRGSYTGKFFSTGTKEIIVDMDLERSGKSSTPERKLEVVLYEKKNLNSEGTQAATQTVEFNTITATKSVKFTGLDGNKFYYLHFKNISSTYAASSLDISATLYISEK